ncbi:hypothetical protein ZWY2020_058804 [Hordeum vulgare]|nr:hypothetical protein ZWY2020_058804 [Hordeum vulgare]
MGCALRFSVRQGQHALDALAWDCPHAQPCRRPAHPQLRQPHSAETPGEDPTTASRYSVAFVKGLQLRHEGDGAGPGGHSVCKVLLELKGKLSGMGFHVPIVNVSVLDLTLILGKASAYEKIKDAIKSLMLLTKVTIVVVVVPEGLPLAVTLT